MKVLAFLSIVTCYLLAAATNLPAEGKESSILTVNELKCENLTNPRGIDILSPQLGWTLKSPERSQKQSACRILVSDREADLSVDKGNYWDTGKITSGETSHIPYRGKPLKSGLKLFWKVRVWDGEGNGSAWSPIASWEMGYLNASDWQAKWIGAGEDRFPDSTATGPAPWFRKAFLVPAEIQSARIRVCGLGFYELYLNGARVGDQVLAPAQTNFDTRKLQKLIYFHDDQSRQRVLYNTYDVTGMLKTAGNVCGIVLGNGWYNQRDRTAEGCLWYNTPRLILQLEINYRDGGRQIVCSDKSWKMTTGPLLRDGIFTGEYYDARLELTGWNTVGFDDSHWQYAVEVKAPAGKLNSQLAPPDRVIRTIKPVFLKKNETGSSLFDAGEMISGWVNIKLHGDRGDTVRLRYIEELGRDYHQVDTYILKGGGDEFYEPRFTWHAFRQIEVSGLKYQPSTDDLVVKVVHTDVAGAGHFDCSNPLFNKIYDNYLRTQLENLHGSISSDCPHRERLGYTGDGQVAVESALFNFDLTTFYRKWFLDMEDARNHKTGYVPHTVPFGGGGGGPAWGSGYVIMPWAYYRFYGDKSLLENHYEGMKQWVTYLGTRCDSAGIVVREEPKGWCLGDWATPEKIKLSPELVNSCYYFHVTMLMSKIAATLGKLQDQKYFENLAESIRNHINRRFYNREQACYLDGKQGANIFPLAFGIVRDRDRARVFATVLKLLEEQKYHFDTGILATPLLLKVLTENGRPDLAYTLMNQKDFPGYGNYILGKDATTLWENWDGASSHSHPMYGSVIAWFFTSLAGIAPDPAHPGKPCFVIAPFVNNELTYANASYHSVYGWIASCWKKNADALDMEIEIPVNSSALVHFPCGDPKQVTESGSTLLHSENFSYIGKEQGKVIFQVSSGKYHFKILN